MTGSFQDAISQVELLLKKGDNKKALELLEKTAAHEGLSTENRLICTLLESRLKIKLGDLKKALSLAETGLQKSLEQEDPLRAVESLTIKAEISWRRGDLDNGFKAVEEGEKILEGIQIKETDEKTNDLKKRKGELLSQRGIIHWYKGELDAALEYLQLSLDIMEELGDLLGKANCYNNLGLVYWSKGELDQAIEYHQRRLAIYEQIGDRRNIATSLNNLGNAYCMKGELDDALKVYQQSLAIRMELDPKKDIDTSYINIGNVYQMKGELNSALDYYQMSLVISEESGKKANIALATNNSGDIHMLRGELDQALELFQKCLVLYKDLGRKQEIALSLSNLGEVYWKRGDIGQSLEYYQQSLTIHEEMDNAPYAALVLFNLVRVALEREDPSSAEQYLKKLEGINERAKNKIIDQCYRIAKALILKASKRTRYKVEAGRILEEVISEEIRNHSLTVTAMIYLCDLLLSEIKLTGEEESFEEIKELTDQLLEIAQRQSSRLLLAETYLVQSKLALIELDMGQTRKLLGQALSIAEEKGLNSLTREVTQELDSLQSQVTKWESLIRQHPSKREMIDATHIDMLLERMIQKTVVTVMEEKGISDEHKPKRKYKLVYVNRLKDPPKNERHKFRVGIAQIGLSEAGDILHELYLEHSPGLFGLREEMVEPLRSRVKTMVEGASAQNISVLIFPELTIDLNYPQILEDIMSLAKTHQMYLIPGSYHNKETRQNLSLLISPDGILWEQAKHIPATIHFERTRLTEGIVRGAPPHETIISCTEYGRIAIVICRDFLDMDLRVRLKNADPPVDIIINPAFTPVTADFKAAHFDARRSIYAYCFFANVAEFGDSLIYTPEKEQDERHIPVREEGLIYKEVDLFKLRSERKKWEIDQTKGRPFIQSTR